MAKRKKTDTETTSEINLNKNSLSEIAETQENATSENVSEAKTLNLPADTVPPTVLVSDESLEEKSDEKVGIEEYNQGVSLFQEGNFKQAMDAFQACYELGNYQMQAAYARGLCQKNLGLSSELPKELVGKEDEVGAMYVASNLVCYLIQQGYEAVLQPSSNATQNVATKINNNNYIIQISGFFGAFSNWAWRKTGKKSISIADPSECPNPTKTDKIVLSLVSEASSLPLSPILQEGQTRKSAPEVGTKADKTKEVKETAKFDTIKPLAKSAASTGGGMSALSKALVVGLVVLLASVGLLVWKSKVGSQGEGLTKLSKQDMEIIFKDAPPQALKRLAEDPELKKKQIDEIKQFLAVAQEARATGFADKAEVRKDLEEIRMTITAVSYNKEKNKDKENLPPFSDITKESVDAFFQKDGNQEKFDKLVKEQIDAAKKDGKLPENFEPPAAQLEQYKQQFAKVRLAAEEANSNWSSLSEEFKSKTELQIKLQQAQYLEQKYSEDVIAKKVAATDEEVKKYLADNADADPKGEIRKYIDDHPPLTKEQKKAKAEDLMKRAKAGEDFAKLAEEFSDDSGSKKNGGLYKDVTSGKMMPEFEKAALALEAGQITDSLVETQYGYHIIKLDRKGTTKGADGKDAPTYDARHILISTMPDDAQSPAAPIKQKIEDDKKKKIVDEIVARHPIQIEDFEIKVPPMPEGQNIPGMPQGMPQGQNGQQPQLSPEQMEQLQKQLKQMQEQQKNAPKPTGKDAPKPTSKDGK